MKANITDKDTLNSIKIIDLIQYLRAHNWDKMKSGDNYSIWTFGDDYEILLPSDHDIGDYPARMRDALNCISIVEDRSQLEIITDINIVSADVYRLRIIKEEASDGTLQIENGATIVQKIRDVIIAGACAVTDKKPLFNSKKPSFVSEHLKMYRLGQTERGSYVFTVISKINPKLSNSEKNVLFDIEEPFERQINLTIAKSLNAIKIAANDAAETGSFDKFRESVKYGVSANLCDAISGLAEHDGNANPVEFMFSWSKTRPVSEVIPQRTLIQQDIIPIIKEASTIFKDTAPRLNFEAVGMIVKLQREDDNMPGKITLATTIDDRPRKVIVTLMGEAYHNAVKAHDDAKYVSFEGELRKVGKQYEILSPGNMKTFEDPELIL